MNNAKLAEFDDEHNAAGQRTSSIETFLFDGAAHVSEIDWTYDSAGRLVDEVFNHYDDTLDQSKHFGRVALANAIPVSHSTSGTDTSRGTQPIGGSGGRA